jgi:multiple sugar transport system substrate-binding protein
MLFKRGLATTVGAALFACAQLALTSGSATAEDVTLRALFMKQTAYSDDDVRGMTADFEKANPGIKVDLEFVPYEALHDKIVASINAGNSGYDVTLFDTIWPAEFAENHFLTDVTDKVPPHDQIFDGAWKTAEFDRKIWGMPWIMDTKYLFYNKDILAKAGIANPPKTWEELMDQAKIIKQKGLVQYPIAWSWGQAEALVCDYALLVQAFNGEFYQGDKPAFAQGGALDALKFMTRSLKDGISNPRSTEFLEEDVRGVFSSGRAAFALNWTYMWPLVNDPTQSSVAGKVGVMPAPGVEGRSSASSINGSMGLGILEKSQHKEEAWKFIQFLSSQATQNKYAKLSLPIWKSSYDDPAVTKGQEELIGAAKTSIGIMFNRPVKVQYQEISTILQKEIQNALFGNKTPEQAMQDVDSQTAKMH